ncbi:MAG: sugar ABC transporter ATP-binding protein [Verrucomicrobia bacterium]|nr:MAG: sugar ABC transporter ATP-binding protein [Verrucomicrobiota bacterium]
MAKVSLKKISKVYPGKNGQEVIVVSDLDLEIQDREFVVLVGPPACGLSSVVRMIAGLEDVSRGEIWIDDRAVNDLPPKDHGVALVAGDHTLYPRMSVSENLAFGLKLRKFPKAELEKRVRGAAAAVGLEELLERKPESLSREQCQRVAIARAVALQPKVYLFDEPLATVEAKARGPLRSEIAKLQQRLDATTLYATHDPVEAMAMGGRIVVLGDGTVQQEGTARELYDEPANLFVAGFLGRAPMNFIRGTLKRERDGLLFSEMEEGTIEVRLPISKFPATDEFAGKTVLLGIRPEEIGIAGSAATEKYVGDFPALIDHAELLGAEADLYLRTGAHTLISRIPGGSSSLAQAGHRGRFLLNMNRLHMFDPDSTRRIAPPS